MQVLCGIHTLIKTPLPLNEYKTMVLAGFVAADFVLGPINVTGPAKTGHVGANYTQSCYRSYLSTGKVYFHSVTCIVMPIKG